MTYQEQIALMSEKRRPAPAQFATVAAVSSGKVQLKFDGETEATAKYYKCNSGLSLAVGDRVKVKKVFGTYIAEYKI